MSRDAAPSAAKMGATPPRPAEKNVGQPERQPERRGEPRLPAAAAVVGAAALYAILPQNLLVGPRLIVPALELLLLVPLVAVNPTRLDRQTRWSRGLSVALVLVVAAANLSALVLLVRALVTSSEQQGPELLRAALEVWLTNIILFALTYWELDRGGPVARTQLPRTELPPADFRFPQDEDDDATVEVARRSSVRADWIPAFVDYLYVSITNSSAFSPTDTMPLSPRAKMLMGLQSVAALITSVLVIARGVSLLK